MPASTPSKAGASAGAIGTRDSPPKVGGREPGSAKGAAEEMARRHVYDAAVARARGIGYAGGPMQLDVYQTDAEAFEAAAERVAALLGRLGTAHPTVALCGGR